MTGRPRERRRLEALPVPAPAPAPAPAPEAELPAVTGRPRERRRPAPVPAAAPTPAPVPAPAPTPAPAPPKEAPPKAVPAAPPSNIKIGPDADMSGVDQRLLQSFNQFAAALGQPVRVNSAWRSDEKQAELWVRANVYKDPSVKMPAKPKQAMTITYNGQEHQVPGGKGSKHNLGAALDISTAGMGDSKGLVDDLLAKFGLHRPHLPKDPPHIQLMADGGIAGAYPGAVPAGPGPVIPLKNADVPVDLGTAGDIMAQLQPVVDRTDPIAAVRESVAVDIRTAVRRLAQELSQPKESQIEMLALLRDIGRTNAETADISNKIARSAAN